MELKKHSIAISGQPRTGDPKKCGTGTLTSQDNHGVQINERIRRLTPIECERLQGFPDDWTKYGIFEGVKKEISDMQRYKTLGNAVTTKVVELIIKKIYYNN